MGLLTRGLVLSSCLRGPVRGTSSSVRTVTFVGTADDDGLIRGNYTLSGGSCDSGGTGYLSPGESISTDRTEVALLKGNPGHGSARLFSNAKGGCDCIECQSATAIADISK